MRTLIASLLIPGSLASVASAEIDFNRDIRPILSDRCFKCHGPDAKNQKSDFRLDTREHAIADLGGYAGIVPGNLDHSELHYVIHSDDPDDVMPPPKSKMSLTAEEKELLSRWIKEGAPYDKHWSLKELPAEVAPPEADPWDRTAIDAFIRATARENDLEPAAEATAVGAKAWME